MEKIEFKDLPDTSTPLTAEIFNTLQDNVENAIDETKKNIETEVDAIIESGSNESGNYVKYASGKQECYGVTDFPSGAFDATGSVFYRVVGSVVFPIAFIEAPMVNCNVYMGNVGACELNNVTNVAVSFRVMSAVATERAATVHWRAVGKWKQV